MDNEVIVQITRFRASSARLFQMLYEDFDANARKLDRQKDENVFLQLQGRYLNELEKQLKGIAQKMMSTHSTAGNMKELQNELTKQISFTLSQFAKKTRYT